MRGRDVSEIVILLSPLSHLLVCITHLGMYCFFDTQSIILSEHQLWFCVVRLRCMCEVDYCSGVFSS
jgi:hypothetical protein